MMKKNMRCRKPLRRVQINSKWHDVREGWANKLELCEYMKAPEYTADEPYAHISNLFWVYNTNGTKVGEFRTENNSCGGSVNSFVM